MMKMILGRSGAAETGRTIPNQTSRHPHHLLDRIISAHSTVPRIKKGRPVKTGRPAVSKTGRYFATVLFSKPSSSRAAIALDESNVAAGSILQIARLAGKSTSTSLTPGWSARVSRTLGAQPVGHVIPGTLNTTVCRWAPPAVDEPDSAPPAGPESVLSEQPTTSNRASNAPHKRFMLDFLSRNEKNRTQSATTKEDTSRIHRFGNRLKDDKGEFG